MADENSIPNNIPPTPQPEVVVPKSAPVTFEPVMSGIIRRAIASYIDFQLSTSVFLLFFLGISGSTTPQNLVDNVVGTVVFGLIWFPLISQFFNAILISKLGGTVGKIMAGLSVVGENLEPVGFLTAFARQTIGYTVSGMLFWSGFLWIAIDKKHQGWHDQIVGTYVIVKNKGLVWLGILLIVGSLLLNLVTTIQIFGNFTNNRSIYTEMFSTPQSPSVPYERLTPESI